MHFQIKKYHPMIKFVQRKHIDDKKWDKLLRKSYNGIIYATSDYLNLMCDGMWNALIKTNDKDEYVAVMPLPFKKKFGITYLYQPFFSQQLGVFSKEKVNTQLTLDFLKAIPKQYRLVEINLNEGQKIEKEEPQTGLSYFNNYVLDLKEDYKTLYKTFSKNQKRNIKKAVNQELILDKNINVEDVIYLFKKHKAKTLNGLKDEFYIRLLEVVEYMKNNKEVMIWGVKNQEGTLLSGAVFIKSFNRWIFLFSGTSDQGKAYSAMPFLLNAFIKQHCNSALFLDFEGSNHKNLAKFYASFGAKKKKYIHYKRYLFPINLIKK